MDEETKKAFEERKKEMKENEFIFSGTTSMPKEIKKVKLKDVHEAYKKNLYVEDTKRIDVVLATALSQKIEGIPLWLFLVGASGDMKTLQLMALQNEDTYILHNLTSKTLVNGYKNKKEQSIKRDFIKK